VTARSRSGTCSDDDPTAMRDVHPVLARCSASPRWQTAGRMVPALRHRSGCTNLRKTPRGPAALQLAAWLVNAWMGEHWKPSQSPRMYPPPVSTPILWRGASLSGSDPGRPDAWKREPYGTANCGHGAPDAARRTRRSRLVGARPGPVLTGCDVASGEIGPHEIFGDPVGGRPNRAKVSGRQTPTAEANSQGQILDEMWVACQGEAAHRPCPRLHP